MALTAFERYFDLHFQTSLDHVGDEKVFSDEMTPISAASWDRKAAYLLWCELGRPGETKDVDAEWDIL